jgi:DNA-binding MarR family transcriptional regulator
MRDYDKIRRAYKRLRLLDKPTSRILLKAITENPGMTQDELLKATGIEQSVASTYCHKLQAAGVVDLMPDRKYVLHVVNHNEIARINSITFKLAEIFDEGTARMAMDLQDKIGMLQHKLTRLKEAV